jgi:predicted MPP superfamily phosphohydrolase
MKNARLLTLHGGIAMVVTDLHGAWQPFERICETFLRLKANQQADYLVLCGDLIHPIGVNSPDASLEMLYGVMQLQAQFGREVVIMLAGNHEMPHIYDVMFSRGESLVYNARLEHAIQHAEKDSRSPYKRFHIQQFLMDLPFYVVTQAGVTLCHAGAPPFVKTLDVLNDILTFDHRALLRLGQDKMERSYDLNKLRHHAEYRQQVRDFLAIEDMDDPRYTAILRGQILSQTEPMFELLWNTLFLRNERGRNIEAYLHEIDTFLDLISQVSQYDQRVLVAGHVITPQGGYKVVGANKFRLASHAHATPPDEGNYLLLDCAKPIHHAQELVPFLHKTMR